MAEDPWLTIVGIGEDGAEGLPPASRRAVEAAEVVMGPPRHLALLGKVPARTTEWPVPFAEGLPLLHERRGRPTVVLASGDPFWHGAGSVLAREFERHEWRALPAPSTFSLVAARMGWPLETTLCLGLHAAPLNRLRPHMTHGRRAILLLRDGGAVTELATLLVDDLLGESEITVFEALGGPRERMTLGNARISDVPEGGLRIPEGGFRAPVTVAIEMKGRKVMPCASGLPDDLFESDGQITKRPLRALALSALAPHPGETLWDIGGGSGSIAIEWLLAHPLNEAISIEPGAERAARIRRNADRLGADRLRVVKGAAPTALEGLPAPDAIFVGGGLSDAMVTDLERRAKGARLVAHAVTLESEALLALWSARLGGELMRVEISQPAPLGPKRGWKAAYPVTQWRVQL